MRRRRDDIIAAVELGISNGRVEAIDNKIKVTVRMGYGFRNTDNLVALLMLRCGDCRSQLPGRPVKARKKGAKGAKSVAAQASPLSRKLPKPPFLAMRCARSDSYLIYAGQAWCFL